MGILNCDKCGELVPENNDAVTWEAKLTGNWTLVVAIARHLYPTNICEGSPSRVKYINEHPEAKEVYDRMQLGE